ncbi:MAG TPA: peptidase [Rhizobiales bacterium]|nr:peptidase [Hyphomicrobiales bacterium]HAN64416.1 peptidase [Hyphomicrobiales bacterium]HBH42041.1 peptidase [Hyphomicrobiales bacterium]HBR27140.1 peptidase [Hyphomicrobiales bacterium]HCL61876.1 peptidase [Hyphomicrobiales bacterium]
MDTLQSLRCFRHKGLRRLFESDDRRAIPASFADKLRDMLAAIDTANAVEDVGLFPGRRLHRLKGNPAVYWSVTVSGNWRVIFRFDEGDAFDLDLVDYH